MLWEQFIEEIFLLTDTVFTWQEIVLYAFGVLWFLQMFYYWFFFSRLAFYKTKDIENGDLPVSVIIAARDEFLNLKEFLPLVLEQDYPEFEVIVVNNDSTDQSHELLLELADENEHLKVINIPENLNFFKGKKYPLSIGIKSASYDTLVLTDADCMPASKDWLRRMVSPFEKGTDIVLGYGDYMRNKRPLGWLMRFDTFYIALQYLSFSLSGLTYMGVGRNLAYKKELFYKQKGFIKHYNISSGDDDLFINQAARKSKVAIRVEKEAHTLSRPKTKFRHWFRQKRRHMTTGGEYRFVHKFFLGLLTLSQFLFFSVFAFLLSFKIFILSTLALFALRFISQLLIFKLSMNSLGIKKLFVFSPIAEILMLIFNIIFTVSNLFRKPDRWT